MTISSSVLIASVANCLFLDRKAVSNLASSAGVCVGEESTELLEIDSDDTDGLFQCQAQSR